MSMAWKDIDKAVREGGKSLNLIAKGFRRDGCRVSAVVGH